MPGSDRCSAHLSLVGRKPSITPEKIDLLIAMLSAGNYVETACRAAGVPRRTFDDWVARGASTKPKDALYHDFRQRVSEARAKGEVRNVAAIAAAASESWQAAAWMLERQYPERWGRVSVRFRDEAPPSEQPVTPATDDDDPFAEVDELAERRRTRAG